MSSQLQRAKIIAERFTPTEPSSECYVYIYRGQATYDASEYTETDGKLMMSGRVWHLDESRTDCVSYVGRGKNGRIDDPNWHPVFPSEELRIKLRGDLSYRDSAELERQIIGELGCICDDERPDGCLVNLRYHERGPYVCSRLEAQAYQAQQASVKGGAARAVDIICMTEDKTIVSRGSASELARELAIHHPNIVKCCKRRNRGIWQPSEKRALYFCYAEDYETYEINPMTNRRSQANRLMVAQKIDGSDICCGTAAEISKYAGLRMSSYLHLAAQGQYKSTQGWVARYISEDFADGTPTYEDAVKLLLHP